MKTTKNLLIVCIILISSNAFSQSFFGKIAERLHFGVKAGANFSNFTNAEFDTEGLVGFHAGAIVGYKISDSFSIEEEFLYSQQGAKLKGNIIGESDIKLSYFTVPILLKYKTPMGLFIEAGPQVGILIDEDMKALGIPKGTDFAEKIDGGVTGGIGWQFKNGLGISARYYMSLTDVTKNTAAGTNTDFKNSSAQAGVFYIF